MAMCDIGVNAFGIQQSNAIFTGEGALPMPGYKSEKGWMIELIRLESNIVEILNKIIYNALIRSLKKRKM